MTKDDLTAQFPALRLRLLRQAQRHVAPDVAEDLVQETLCALCRRLDAVDGDAGPWAGAVLYRLIGRMWREAKPHEPLVDAQTGRAVELPVAAGQEAALEAGKALRLIADLPPRRRALYVAVALEGEPLEAAAKAHGLPVGTAKSRVHRTGQHLRAALQGKRVSRWRKAA